jgi:hypothetical protein
MMSNRTVAAQTVPLSKPPKPPKPMSPTARRTLATNQLKMSLGSDEKAAITAALEVVNEWLPSDPTLRQRLVQRYGELVALAAPRPRPAPTPRPKPDVGAGPARRTTLEKLDPYQLFEDVGRERLRAALANTTQKRLRTAVDAVQARNPGTKPASRTVNQDMIDYIVQQLAGSSY